MPRKSQCVPTYRFHKTSGNGVVTLRGKDFYLGPYHAPETRAEYYRLIAAWLKNGRRIDGLTVHRSEPSYAISAESPMPADDGPPTISINEVMVGYLKHCEGRFMHRRTGKARMSQIRSALRPMKNMFGPLAAGEFRPKLLLELRCRYMQVGWTRKTVNEQVGIIRDMFAWATVQELVKADVHHALLAVKNLHKGETTAPEHRRIRPVTEDQVHAVLPHVSKPVAAMIRLQWLAGMRPGEVVIMRGCDLNMEGEVWTFRPQYHKTEHHGDDHERVIYLGPEAQGIVREFLKPNLEAYLFSPRDAESTRHAKAKSHRRAKQKSNLKKTDRTVGDRYDVGSFRRSIERACDAAFPPPSDMTNSKAIEKWRREHRWTPHRLRHACATRIRKAAGLDGAAVVLGHKHLRVSEVYAELDSSKASVIAAKLG